MKVKAWNNGSFKKTGAGYGISIPIDCRAKYFKRDWNSIILNIEDIFVEIKLNTTFWTTCNELRSKEIGKFLKKNELQEWEKDKPYELELISCGEKNFKLVTVESNCSYEMDKI